MKNFDLSFNWKNKNIVVVEDDVSNFRYFETILKKTRASVHWIKDGREAVNYCTNTSNNIDLVIMDILVPFVTGIEATREIKKSRKNIPVIAVTAYVSRDIKEKCFMAGCDEFMFKPLLPKQLLNSIAYFFEKDQVTENQLSYTANPSK